MERVGTPIPDEVQQQLEQIDHVQVQKRLHEGLSALEHIENPHERREEGFQPELVGDSERVLGHMQRITDVTHQAHEAIRLESPETEPTPRSVWERTTAALSEQALDAKEKGDSEAARAAASDLLLVLGIATGNSEYDEETIPPARSRDILAESIGSGLGQELVEARRDAHGLVAQVEDHDGGKVKYREVGGGLDTHTELIELAIGKEVSYDVSEPATGQELTEGDWQDRLDKRSSYDSAELARVLSEQEDVNADRIDLVVANALSERHLSHESGRGDRMAEVIRKVADAVPGLRDGKYDSQLHSLRRAREVGNHYRGNNTLTMDLDKLAVSLWTSGDKHVAGQLLTVNPSEISSDGSSRGELDAAASHLVYQEIYSQGEVDQTLKEVSEALVLRRQEAETRLEELQEKYPEFAGSGNDSVDLIRTQRIFGRFDPESHMDMVEANADVLKRLIKIEGMSERLEHVLNGDYSDRFDVIDALTSESFVARLEAGEDDWLKDLVGKEAYVLGGIAEHLDNDEFMQVARNSSVGNKFVREVHQGYQPNMVQDVLAAVQSAEASLVSSNQAVKDIIIEIAVSQREMMEQTIDALSVDGVPDMLLEDSAQQRIVSNLLRSDPEQITPEAMELLRSDVIDQLINNPVSGEHFVAILSSESEAGGSKTLIQKIELAQQILGQPREKWVNLFEMSEALRGLHVEDARNEHLLSSVPKVRLPLGTNEATAEGVQAFEPKEVAGMTVAEKRGLLKAEVNETLTDDDIANMGQLQFDNLRPEVMRQVYGYMLHETVRLTRDDQARTGASERNARLAESSEDMFSPSDFIHGVRDASALGSILQDGNFAGESRGVVSAADAFPFNVDVSIIGRGSTPREQYEESITAGYGALVVIYKRDTNSWMAGQTSVPDADGRRDRHGLVLGGIPSTEITGVMIANADLVSVDQTKASILEAGFYVPIYDRDGALLYTPEDYKHDIEDRNMAVPVSATLDSAHVSSERLGSNEGYVYMVPTSSGKPQQHYIKFGGMKTEQTAKGEDAVSTMDHVWTEYLADQLYREMGVAVPETRMVSVDGRVGHDSLWVDETLEERPEAEATTLNGGFVVDAWLANWDVVYNDENTLEVDGVIYRSDNGGALDLRAQGQRKPVDIWDGTVRELQMGENDERLGLGMRQKYPGLTDGEVRDQAEALRDRMTDEVIDQMVDSIRRPRADRDQLKATLKARRDNIIETVLT